MLPGLTPARAHAPATRRPRVLIINAYVNPWRSATPTRLFIPRAMAPYYLAGTFDRSRVDVRVYDEVHHGTLLDAKVYAWPDVVVFTGLTAAFDRTRQLSAYFRHCRPGVVTVIGGPIARALPNPCRAVFDHVCLGDVDEMGQVTDEILGPGHRAEVFAPAYELGGRSRLVGAVETTTNCNFACAFCSLSGEGRAYRSHSPEAITRQIEALGRVHALTILDNNFYGNDRASFEMRTRLLGEHWRRGAFQGWGALVTMDFFARPENIELVARNGCVALFSGVESLDPAILKSYNKRHSLSSDPASLSRACAAHGIIFDYGMIFDFAQQTTSEVGAQLGTLLGDPDIPLPGLLSLTIPILGTPYFDAAAKAGRLMPNLRLADLDGQKVVEWPQESLEAVVPFVRDLLALRGRKGALVRQALAHTWRRRHAYRTDQTLFNLFRPLLRYGGTLRVGTPRQMLHGFKEKPRTYCAMTDPLPATYTPHIPLPSRFEADFRPAIVTDSTGAPTVLVATRLDNPPVAAPFRALASSGETARSMTSAPKSA